MSVNGEGAGAVQASGIVAFVCPKCGWTGEFDSRFTAWCEGCGFKADGADTKPVKPRAARRIARVRARAERQCERLLGTADLRPTSATGVAVTVAATVVHLMTLVVLGGSIAAFVFWSRFWFAWPLGLVGFALAVVVRPRLWQALRKPRGIDAGLTRSKAPTLFALLDRCAAELRAPVPDYVLVDGRFNASTARFGLRRRTTLRIGAPLWTVLSGPERLALLGHELGHQVNRDTTHGIWAWAARRSLIEWIKLFNPRSTSRDSAFRQRVARSRRTEAGIASLLAPVVVVGLFGPVFLIACGCYSVLTRLDLTCGQRAEHLADELGARVASSAAAIGLIDQLAQSDSVEYFVRREKAARFTGDLWPALREYVNSIPDHEKRRRVRIDEARGIRIDSGHPANYLRRRLLAGRPPLPGTLRVDDAEWAAIDAELQRWFDQVGNELLGGRRRASVSAQAAARG